MAKVVWWQRRLSARGGGLAIDMLERAPLGSGMMRSEDIDRYVEAGLRVGGWLGLVNSCLTRTVIRCLLHRLNGRPARAAFGLNKAGEALEGHCWLADEGPRDEESGDGGFQSIVIHPA